MSGAPPPEAAAAAVAAAAAAAADAGEAWRLRKGLGLTPAEPGVEAWSMARPAAVAGDNWCTVGGAAAAAVAVAVVGAWMLALTARLAVTVAVAASDTWGSSCEDPVSTINRGLVRGRVCKRVAAAGATTCAGEVEVVVGVAAAAAAAAVWWGAAWGAPRNGDDVDGVVPLKVERGGASA